MSYIPRRPERVPASRPEPAGREAYLTDLLAECRSGVPLDVLLEDVEATVSAARQIVELTRTMFRRGEP